MKNKLSLLFICISLAFVSCTIKKSDNRIDVDQELMYFDKQIRETLKIISKDSCMIPRSIDKGEKSWKMCDIYDWTSGFWPGILWYDYMITNDSIIRQHAIHYTECLLPLINPRHEGDHDIGFQIFTSFGNAYNITRKEEYKNVILEGARKLARLYNPKVGTILSWPGMVEKMGWPHNTIMDNMMNLEILFWASKNGGGSYLYDIALSHAKVTMKNSFRNDGGNYHVAVYDTIDGSFIKGVTNQGYGDSTLWARGQAWAIYGYTMVYRETGDKTFLRFAEKLANLYLARLPEDYIPYWDFDAVNIKDCPKDASAAAITSSALIELSKLEDDETVAQKYRQAAIRMLKELSSERYQAGNQNPALIMHSTGNYPGGYEIDAAINYADYYYLQALYRYKKMIVNE